MISDDKFYYLRNESSYHRNLRVLCVVLATAILNRDSMSRRGYKLGIIIELPLTDFFSHNFQLCLSDPVHCCPFRP